MRRAVSLSGVVFALLCLATILFALPAGAQDGDDGIPPGTDAIGRNTDGDVLFDVIVVQLGGCTETSSPPSITLEDSEEVSATFTDGSGVTVSTADANGRPRIEGFSGGTIGESATPSRPGFSDSNPYTVVRSEGITCGDGDDAGQGQGGAAQGGAAQVQYGEIGEVDEEEDVIVGTTSKKKIPNTGGPPLLLFGALLLGAAVIAGRRVLRP